MNRLVPFQNACTSSRKEVRTLCSNANTRYAARARQPGRHPPAARRLDGALAGAPGLAVDLHKQARAVPERVPVVEEGGAHALLERKPPVRGPPLAAAGAHPPALLVDALERQ